MIKLLLIVTVVIAAVFLFDGFNVLNERRLVNDTSKQAAIAALQTLSTTQDPVKARAAADRVAKNHHDVITTYQYNPVGQQLHLSVSGSAYTLVLHRLNRAFTDDITASAGTH
ncbi:MAG: hypothetical protein NVSMB12_10360 [Acidimicrobiales bacterium]